MKAKLLEIDGSDAYNMQETMEKMDKTRPTIMTMIKKKKIGYYKIGGQYVITQKQINDFWKNNKHEAEV